MWCDDIAIGILDPVTRTFRLKKSGFGGCIELPEGPLYPPPYVAWLPTPNIEVSERSAGAVSCNFSTVSMVSV